MDVGFSLVNYVNDSDTSVPPSAHEGRRCTKLGFSLFLSNA